ncbi:hypothetical protein A3715_17355 [Oleiphilus sp. HI0009]|nr:hypothetical protein A3715_17355 [Oleiphilus sp. HI0009]
MSIESEITKYQAFFDDSAARRLLSSRTASFVLATLDYIFEQQNSIDRTEFINKLNIVLDRLRLSGSIDSLQTANDYLNAWLESGYVVDRESKVHLLDPVMQVKRFIDDNAHRTADGTTQTQLTVVQDLLNELVSQVSENPDDRVRLLQIKIAEAEHEIDQIKKGNFKPLSGASAVERVRHFFNQAKRLQNDFVFLEQELRESTKQVIRNVKQEEQSRGGLLKKYVRQVKELSRTPSGQAFTGFYRVLSQASSRNLLQDNIAKLISSEAADNALTYNQSLMLKTLVRNLTNQAHQFHDARRDAEKTLKDFIERELTEDSALVIERLNTLDALAVQNSQNTNVFALKKQNTFEGQLSPLAIKPHVHMNLYSPEKRFDPSATPETKTISKEDASKDLSSAVNTPNAKKSFKLISAYLNETSPLSISKIAEQHTFKNMIEFLSFSQVFYHASNDDSPNDTVVNITTKDGRHLTVNVPDFKIEQESFPDTYEDLVNE